MSPMPRSRRPCHRSGPPSSQFRRSVSARQLQRRAATDRTQSEQRRGEPPSRARVSCAEPSPLGSSKQSIELKGEHAAHSRTCCNRRFISISSHDPEAQSLPLAERFRIARLEPKKDARVVGNLKVAITGKISQQEFYLPATAEQLPGGWIRLKPSQPLPPGEYAVVEILGPKTMNLYVWDFGVNPSSPENPGAWKSASEPPTPADNAGGDVQSRPH